jgi:transcriptional regulator with XRE-family HTH domain
MTTKTSLTRQSHTPVAAVLAATGLAPVDLAKNVGCSRAHLSRLRSGERRPGRSLAARFQRLYGVPLDAWDSVGGLMDPNGQVDQDAEAKGAAV